MHTQICMAYYEEQRFYLVLEHLFTESHDTYCTSMVRVCVHCVQYVMGGCFAF